MKVVISQPMYLPWLGQFNQALWADKFVILDDVQFTRGFFNRVQISQNEAKNPYITIPIKGHKRANLNSLLIAPPGDWWPVHRQKLISATAKAPFHRDVIEQLSSLDQIITSFSEGSSLSSLTSRLFIFACNSLLGDKTPDFSFSSGTPIGSSKSDRILDLCKLNNATQYLTGLGGLNYLEKNKFISSGIELKTLNYYFDPSFLSPNFNPFCTYLEPLAVTSARNFCATLASTIVSI